MSPYTQDGRWMRITTGLGKDKLLLVAIDGEESLSEPFRYTLQLLAPHQNNISFDQLVGSQVTVELETHSSGPRLINGLVRSLTQHHRDAEFTHFEMEVVPKWWRLQKRVGSQIFQQKTVAQIAASILGSAGIAHDIQLFSQYLPHNYCVQFEESDFDFLSRLLAEQGIYYYFRHEADNHVMVLSDRSVENPLIAGSARLLYDPGADPALPEPRILRWSKTQQVCGGKVTLWDYSFQLPSQHLQVQCETVPEVMAGQVKHSLHGADSQSLETYLFPGAYAHMFDGIGPGGADQEADMQHLFVQNEQSVRVRMEAEAIESVTIKGESRCAEMTSGNRFELKGHFDGDGEYLITHVKLQGTLSVYRGSGESESQNYRNEFTAIPASVPFRPQQKVRRRAVQGMHTAVVVGPAGEEIFTDKFGRIKVQFHWDRFGSKDANSSCWLRVSHTWSGSGYGNFHLPRIGQEVLVGYVNGDIDQPLVVGSVHNAAMPTPFSLPEQRTLSGITSRSRRGTSKNASLFHIDDTLGREQMILHSENHLHQSAEKSRVTIVGWGQPSASSNGGSGGGMSASVTAGSSQSQVSDRNDPGKPGDATVSVATRDPMTHGEGGGQGGGDSGGDWEGGSTDKVRGASNEFVYGNELKCVVGASEDINIGVDFGVKLGASIDVTLGSESSFTIGNAVEGIVGNSTGLVTGNETKAIKGNSTEIVDGNEVYYIKGEHIEKVVKGDISEVGGSKFESIGTNGGAPNIITMLNNRLVEFIDGEAKGNVQTEQYEGVNSCSSGEWNQLSKGDMLINADGTLYLSAKNIVICAEKIQTACVAEQVEAASYPQLASKIGGLLEKAYDTIVNQEFKAEKLQKAAMAEATVKVGAAQAEETKVKMTMAKDVLEGVTTGALGVGYTTLVLGGIGDL